MLELDIDARITDLEKFIERKEYLKENHPLRYLFWEATLRCNLNCLHCGSDCVQDNSTFDNEIDALLVMKELESIARKYPPHNITLSITGGEPLLRHDIFEVGAYAASLGYNWGITTNAMLLNDRTILKLKETGLRTISVSLDGLEEDHNKLRNHKSSYKIVIKAMNIRCPAFFKAGHVPFPCKKCCILLLSQKFGNSYFFLLQVNSFTCQGIESQTICRFPCE